MIFFLLVKLSLFLEQNCFLLFDLLLFLHKTLFDLISLLFHGLSLLEDIADFCLDLLIELSLILTDFLLHFGVLFELLAMRCVHLTQVLLSFGKCALNMIQVLFCLFTVLPFCFELGLGRL